MSGKYGSSDFAFLLVDGFNLLASKVQGWSDKTASSTEKTTGLGDGTASKAPTGTTDVTLSQQGAIFDDSTAGSHTALKNAQAVSRILCFAVMGNVIGQAFKGISGLYSMTYEVLVKAMALTKANVAYDINGTLEKGVILQHLTPKTANWDTKALGASVDYTTYTGQTVIPITSNSLANPTVVTTAVPHGLTSGQKVLISGVVGSTPSINGAQTVTVIDATHFSVPVNVTVAGTGGSFVQATTLNGGAGYQQITDMSGFTGFVGKVRSSADDITYADLVTFTNVTAAPSAQRVAVGGTIERYLCASGTVTGAGTLTPFIGFART